MTNAVEPGLPSAQRKQRALAFSVHLFTAAGAAIGLLALMAAMERNWPEMFAWLALSLIIDGLDGTFARKFNVAELLPRWSGDILDLVVDFLNYVIVPVFAIIQGGFMPRGLALAAAAAIVISSAIYFADQRMKTGDGYFRGFPATWNLIAFYFFLLKPGEWSALIVIGVLIVFTFIPVVFVHPMRATRFRLLNIVLCCVWGALAIFALLRDFMPPVWTTYSLVAVAVYFFLAGLLRIGSRA